MANDIIKASNELWASIIDKISFDFLNKKIIFDLLTIDNEVRTNHTFIIESYSDICILGESNSTLDFTFDSCDYYEITSIYFKQYHKVSFDLLIEIWNYKVGFNASSIVIDGIKYNL